MRRGIVSRVALAIALVVAAMLSTRSALAAQTPSGIATDPILQPPYEEGGKPIEVTIGLHVVNLAAIDEVSEQFQLDAYMFARWIDRRLAYSPAGPQDQQRNYAKGQVWTPQLEMINAAAPREHDEISIIVSPDGTVRYAERVLVRLSSRFELRRFPFDSQRLIVLIHPFLTYGPSIKFQLSSTSTWTAWEFKDFSSLAQWHLKGLHSEVGTVPTYAGLTMPEARFEIAVERRSSFYVWKVFLPLLLMVFLSWAVFWIEASDLSNQITVAVTTILTVIAFAFAISATMPRLPYLTYIDAFFLECYIFVFLAVVELMTVHVTHRSEKRRDLGLRIREYSRWVVPAAFALTNVIIAVHFLT
jgi:Neurotransmitter-gated ion-channel ligand binding domain/Neurotransmitter-gated ion-channel transmembrane region